MDILAHNKTLTSQFLMPLLFEGKKYTEIITDFKSFVNAYIADFDKPKYDNKIILVFDKKQKDLPTLNQVDHYTHKIKDAGGETYCYVYDIPTGLEDNYALWLEGKYSLFADKAKEIILNFWEASHSTLLYGVLYKKGVKIKKFYKDHFETEISEKWNDPDKELWFNPVLNKEVYGAE
jgi:hypothetical protein